MVATLFASCGQKEAELTSGVNLDNLDTNYQDAIADFEKAIELKPDYADAYFSLGRTYSCMHDADMSCYYYKMAEKYGRPNLHDLIKNCPD